MKLLTFESLFLSDQSSKDLVQMVTGNDTAEDQPCADPEAATPTGTLFFFRKFCFRKESDIVRVRIHHIRIVLSTLTDGSVLRDRELFAGVITAVVSIIDICYALYGFSGDPACGIGYFYLEIQIHFALLWLDYRELITSL